MAIQNGIHERRIKDLYDAGGARLQSQIPYNTFSNQVFFGTSNDKQVIRLTRNTETSSNVAAFLDGQWVPIGTIDWKISGDAARTLPDPTLSAITGYAH